MIILGGVSPLATNTLEGCMYTVVFVFTVR